MSTSFGVLVDPATLEQSSLGSITGTICVSGEDWSFPDESWNDFPVVLLGWWLEAYRDVSTRLGGTAVCRFMDGPYSIRLISERRELFTVECVSNEKAVVHETHVEARALQESLEAAARTLVWACRSRRWESSDLERLEYALGLHPPPGGSSRKTSRSGARRLRRRRRNTPEL
jgi:hypothetical protein